MWLNNTKDFIDKEKWIAIIKRWVLPTLKSKSVGSSLWLGRPSSVGIVLSVQATCSEPSHSPTEASKGQDTHRGTGHLSWNRNLLRTAMLQQSKKLSLPPANLSKGQSKFKCSSLTSGSIIISIPSLKLGDREISTYVPWMSLAFSTYLARNGQKWVVFIGHLTALILTLLGQQCSGYSPHTCFLLACGSCQGCCQQAQC